MHILPVVSFSTLLTYTLSTAFAKPLTGSLPSPVSSVAYPSPTTTHIPQLAPQSMLPANDCHVDPYNETVPDLTFDAFDQSVADIYRYRQQRAVNLGSWFVHENWLTPSLFTCAADPKVSELDIANGWGSVDSARALLERHWDTFITPKDFKYLADKGINTIRLPIGFWNLPSSYLNDTVFEPVASAYKNSWVRVKRAIKQAAEHGLGVLVDLHAAPGSQNGSEHSGVSDGVIGLFSDPHNVNKTIEMLRFLSKELAGVNNVVGLQILNEPQYTHSLEDFYTQAIDVVRSATPLAKSLPVYLHDGFDLSRLSRYVSQRDDFVVQDHHAYFVFGDAGSKGASDHATEIGNAVSASLSEVASRQRRNLIVGEWSCALTPQSLENEDDAEGAKKAFCEQQLKVYTNATSGWAFWTYVKEDCDSDTGWCFKAALGKTLPSTFLSNESQPRSLSQTFSKMLRSVHRPSADLRRFTTIGTRRLLEAENASFPESKTNARGYSDGFAAAQAFSTANSKLGFTGQYIADTKSAAAEGTIQKITEEEYEAGFLQGLDDGEKLLIS